jgi:hypothetical protein
MRTNMPEPRKAALLLVLFGIASGCGTETAPAAASANELTNAPAAPCACALDQVCDQASLACIARPVPAPGEQVGELSLLRQEAPGDTTILGRLGKAEAKFYDQEPLPNDDRPAFTNGDGERCFFEVGTNYPSSYGGQFWPAGPGLGAGTLRFEVDGGTMPIELSAADYDKAGWGYFLGSSPPPLREGSVTFSDLFDPVVLPSGARFAAKNEGGPLVGAQIVRGELAADFHLDSAINGADGLAVTWSPPEPSAFMEIFVTQDLGGKVGLVSCKVKDDGRTVIPPAAISQLGPRVDLQLRRTVERYTKMSTSGGTTLHMFVQGRRAELGHADLF